MTLLNPEQPPHCSGFFYAYVSLLIQVRQGWRAQCGEYRIDPANDLTSLRSVRAANVNRLIFRGALDRIKQQFVG